MAGTAELTEMSEEQLFRTIDGLGAMLHVIARSVQRGNLDEDVGSKDAKAIHERQVDLVAQLEDRFGVVFPEEMGHADVKREDLPPAPEGKQWYWDWYEGARDRFYGAEYDNLICSACPYSEGREAYVSNSGKYPCSLVNGFSKVAWPSQCCRLVEQSDNTGLTGYLTGAAKKLPRQRPFGGEMERSDFFAKLRNEHGIRATLEFRKHERALEAAVRTGELKYAFGDKG